MTRDLTVAVIGSFRKHYPEVVAAVNALKAAGVAVSSPPVSRITNQGEPYVRFAVDSPQVSDKDIQLATMQKILDADFVYVVAPRGYIGRTTCYELGRAQQKGIPVYFSEVPLDLPIDIPSSSVCTPDELRAKIALSVAARG